MVHSGWVVILVFYLVFLQLRFLGLADVNVWNYQVGQLWSQPAGKNI